MRHRKIARAAGFILSAAAAFLLTVAGYVLSLPSRQVVAVGDSLATGWKLPGQVWADLLQVSGEKGTHQDVGKKSHWPVAKRPGTVNLKLSLFGVLPLRNVTVDVVPRLEVVPGGQSIGVLFKKGGVSVVGFAPVDSGGERLYPAREAGLKVGDVLLAIDGLEVKGVEQAVQKISQVGESGNPVRILAERSGKRLEFTVKPARSSLDGRYWVGLLIRDSAAGVGTLTFYHPVERVYGALGHLIESQGNAASVEGGKVVGALIQGIQQSRRGQPGEKVGLFQDISNLEGTIEKNTPFGIFGTLKGSPANGLYKKPLPLALGGQVREGPATMLTVIAGEKVEEFAVEIEKVQSQRSPEGKSLVVRVTDRRLLEVAGGIVQGMSGSPILQDGRLVGAVTHVFVNDPTRGYGVLAEWMLKQTNLYDHTEKVA